MKDMGLAVVQQLKGNSGFEHGMLASMFDDRAAGKVAEPRLRLVDVNKIEDFLNDPSHSEKIHVDFAALDELRNAALNIESHDEHTAKTTFNYGVKELVKGYGEHDENIASDIGTMKTSNATQSGYNQLREKRRWDNTMQMMLNNQREEYLRRLESQMRQLERQIKDLQGIQKFLEGKTSADFDRNTEEGRRNIEELRSRLDKIEDGKKIEDFTDANGNIDVQAADAYAKQSERDRQQKLDKTRDDLRVARSGSNSEISAQETREVAALVNAEKETAQIKKADTNDILIGITSSFNTSSEVETTASAQPAQALDNQTPLVIASDTTAADPLDDMAGRFASMEQIDVTVAQITNRPLGSVAGNLEGSSNSVLSSDFTTLAKGEIKQVAAPSADITPSTGPALRTMSA